MATLESVPTPTNTAALMLEQTRTIRATRARVYQAWTSPDLLKQWFGPANMYCPSATLDVRVGGSYHIAVIPTPEAAASAATSESEQRHAAATGTYTRIVPNEILQFTWVPSWLPGEESLVTVSFKDVPEGTEITLRHERFSTETSRDGHSKGWAGSLDKLAQTIERK